MRKVLSIILVTVFAWLVVRALLVFIRKFSAERYWEQQLQSKPVAGAIRLVVFGDSIARGIGATRPQRSLVGRAAEYIAKQVGRPVHIANYSKSGATARHILHDQLPLADLHAADIILLEVGVNDSYKRTVEQFEADVRSILAKLPLEKTVIADIPYAKLRRPYQAVVHKLFASHGINRAYASSTFVHLLPTLNVTAGDFWHPNDKGYLLWFKAFQPGINAVLRGSKLLKPKRK